MGAAQSQSQCCFEPAVPGGAVPGEPQSYVEVTEATPAPGLLEPIPVLAEPVEESASAPAEPAAVAPPAAEEVTETPISKPPCASLADLLLHSHFGEVVEGDAKEFQGAWEEPNGYKMGDAKCVHVIHGSKMVMKSFVAGRTFTVSLSFRDGALVADMNGSPSAKIDETGTKLLWADGDVWTRASLNGAWRDSETGAVYTIDGSTMSTAKKEGQSLSLAMEDPGIFSITLTTGKFTATLDPMAMHLDWNDGDVWVREWRNFLYQGTNWVPSATTGTQGSTATKRNRRCSLSGPDEHLVKTASTWLEKGGEAWTEDDIPLACIVPREMKGVRKEQKKARKSARQSEMLLRQSVIDQLAQATDWQEEQSKASKAGAQNQEPDTI